MDKKTVWFIVSVLLFSWMLIIGLKIFNISRSPVMGAMIFPMLMAVIFMAVSKEKFSVIGWKLPKLGFMLLGIFIPLLQMAVVVGVGFMFNLISLNHQHFIINNPTPNVWMNLILCIPAVFVPFILLSFPRYIFGWISHLGEEFAWRGYLFRSLLQKAGLIKALLISGFVWWAWHMPMFWLSPVISELPVGRFVLTVGLSLASMVGTACVFSWIYVKSNSIWAPTIMHLSWNFFRGVLTGRLSDGEPGIFTGDLWLINGEGVMGMIVTALTGLVFYFLFQLDKEKFLR